MRSGAARRAPAVVWSDWLCGPHLPAKRVRAEDEIVALGGDMKWRMNLAPWNVEKAGVSYPVMRKLAGRA